MWCSVCVERRDVVSSSVTGGLLPFAAKRLRTESIGRKIVRGRWRSPGFEGEDRGRRGGQWGLRDCKQAGKTVRDLSGGSGISGQIRLRVLCNIKAVE